MKHAKPIPERMRIRREIDCNLICAALKLDPDDLPQLTISRERKQEFRDACSALVDKGCDPNALKSALRLGRQTSETSRQSIPPLKRVKRLINQLRRLADEIETLESSGFMRLIHVEETERLYFERPPDFDEFPHGDETAHLDLPRWLRKKAELYERWSTLASQKIPPKGGMLTHLTYLIPALYVLEATGKPCVPQLLQLLDTIGVNVDASQVSRNLKALRSDYPSLYHNVQLVLLYIIKNRDCCPE